MARQFDRGCMEYTECDYTIHIGFPKGMEICDLCEFCHTENAGTRFRCMRTAEILPFHNKGLGMRCPLPITLNQKTDEEEN